MSGKDVIDRSTARGKGGTKLALYEASELARGVARKAHIVCVLLPQWLVEAIETVEVGDDLRGQGFFAVKGAARYRVNESKR